jgi:hypothetical protein
MISWKRHWTSTELRDIQNSTYFSLSDVACNKIGLFHFLATRNHSFSSQLMLTCTFQFRLTLKDPCQLYERLEAQTRLAEHYSKAKNNLNYVSRKPGVIMKKLQLLSQTFFLVFPREYMAEVRISLIKFFSSSFTNSLQHAKDCVMTLLDEYQSLCVATDMLKPFFQKLVSMGMNG